MAAIPNSNAPSPLCHQPTHQLNHLNPPRCLTATVPVPLKPAMTTTATTSTPNPFTTCKHGRTLLQLQFTKSTNQLQARAQLSPSPFTTSATINQPNHFTTKSPWQSPLPSPPLKLIKTMAVPELNHPNHPLYPHQFTEPPPNSIAPAINKITNPRLPTHSHKQNHQTTTSFHHLTIVLCKFHSQSPKPYNPCFTHKLEPALDPSSAQTQLEP
jgi:hypothetical protein